MIIERRKNAIKGTFFGLIYKFIQIVFPFIIRTVFIHTLGVEYLGLNSLFTAVLQVLNLAELGVSSALVYSMYKPIVDDDTGKICQILNLYRVYYRIIGVVVLVIGVLLVPFLPKLISGSVPKNVNLYVLYAMHLAATVLSYWLFAYRNSLFQAHQRVDVTTIIQIVVNTCLYVLQTIFLIIFHNYYLYLSLAIIGQISLNIITAILSKRYYPEYVPKGDISVEERKEINQKVRDLFTAKVGAVINNAADSIVISAFLGLELLAIYQNYYYIIAAIMSVFSIFFGACTAGIGNSLITRSEEQNKELLYNINHIVFLGINFCCACFTCMCQPFMMLWVGEQYELPFYYVILFSIYLFAEEAPRTLITFKDAGGMWRHDRFRPLVSACFNLTLNILLTPRIGLYGIVISTIMALMIISYPWLINNIDHRLFNIDLRRYFVRLVMYIVVISIASVVSYLFVSWVEVESLIFTIILRFIFSAIVSTAIFIIVFSKTKENKYLKNQWQILKRRLLKGKK